MYTVNFGFTEDLPENHDQDRFCVCTADQTWLMVIIKSGRIFKDKGNGQSTILPKLCSMFPSEKHIIAFCRSRCVISKIYLATGHIT